MCGRNHVVVGSWVGIIFRLIKLCIVYFNCG